MMEATAASPLTPQVTPAWLAQVADAVTQQLNVDVAPYYGGLYGVRVGSGPTDIQYGEVVFSIVDTLPQAPGAIAYHDKNGNAVPTAYLALSTCSTLDEVSQAISHEICEIGGDAPCDLWVDSGTGQEYAHELSDAVQGNTYTIDTIVVSDFVLPSFFSPGASSPYCFTQAMGVGGNYPSAPLQTTSGGYQIVRTSGTGETQVTAATKTEPAQTTKLAKVVGTPDGPRKDKIKHWSSRAWKRGVRQVA
jgi:hypothetical protein